MTIIFLTGANSFLGRIINILLVTKGFKVTGLDLYDQSVTVDITKPFSLNEDLNPDVVVHAAGKAHSVPRISAEKKVFYDVNFEDTNNLCTALEKLTVKPRSFIFISTVPVYGLDAGYMISENHPLKGETAYAKSRIPAESWLTGWADKNGIRSMINGICSGRYFIIGKADSRKSIVWQEDIPSIITGCV
ncbi:MAG: SDR family oxidoreductase [Ferruginibacter sp.]